MINAMQSTYHPQSRRSDCSGFTLVEMLVSVALVLLMMTMFTAIFSLATESLSTQRALSDNDQKSRMLMTMLREDINNRTFRYVFPYTAGEDTTRSITSIDKRREGYLYISCNDIASGSDDLLQFTVRVPADQDRYTGAAAMLYDQDADPPVNQERRAALHSDPNQPEFDDRQLVPNGIAESSAAEISYFIRNGNLYRRVMLIREPSEIGGGNFSPDPTSNVSSNPLMRANFAVITRPQNISLDPSNANYYILPAGTPAPVSWGVIRSINDLWKHFDFSVIPTPSGVGVNFSSLGDLENTNIAGTSSLGMPIHRFGFNPASGLSREHTQIISGVGGAFIGRYLHAETSTDVFKFPLASSLNADAPGNPILGNGNPMDLENTPVSLNSDGNVTEFVGPSRVVGGRVSEDMVLPNVHEMRIELWDERLGAFTALGYGASQLSDLQPFEVVGDYHLLRRINPSYGPTAVAGSSIGNVFDTWHPLNNAPANTAFDRFEWPLSPIDLTTSEFLDKQPPYVAYRFYPPRRSQSGPSPNRIPDPIGEVEFGSSFTNRGYWVPTTTYSASLPNIDVVFPQWTDATLLPRLGNGLFEPDEVSEPGFQLAFRCVSSTGPTGSVEPTWPTAAGARVTDGGVTWEAIDNRRPLKAIRVTFRSQNEKNLQIKELPIVLSLQD
jgi:prepilin-type N-terminal cleavage/methylation domain-containing protein